MAATKKYAEGTTVPVSRSREEIESLLKKYGAAGFMYGQQGLMAAVMFEMHGRRYRIELKYPPVQFSAHAPRQAEQAQEAEIRRLWRALVLVMKAKLEGVKSGVTTVEEEFLAHTVMANNERVHDWLEPQIKEMYESGQMPSFLPGLPQPGPGHREIKSPDFIEGEVKEE